jgi:hypothetical protein
LFSSQQNQQKKSIKKQKEEEKKTTIPVIILYGWPMVDSLERKLIQITIFDFLLLFDNNFISLQLLLHTQNPFYDYYFFYQSSDKLFARMIASFVV